ncbi:MAG: caspase family protein [Gemmataceae bacterium]
MTRTGALVLLLLPAFARAEDAGKRYALLVGVQDYTGTELANLRHAENDATALADVFRQDGYRLVVLMTRKEGFVKQDETLFPTAANVRKRLGVLLENRKPEDTVVVSFAGHGVVLRGSEDLQFCPLKADLKSKETLIALGEVYAALKGCKAGVKLLIVDACRNEPTAARSNEVANLASVTRPVLSKPPEGVAALFSCSAGEMAFESRKHPHGVFFHHLLEGFQGKAANKKGEVTLERLAAHIKDEMVDTIPEEFGPDVRQRPHLLGDLIGAAPLVRSRPGSDLARRGLEELERREYDAAIETLTKAIQADPTEPLRHTYRAEALMYRGRFVDALADANLAVQRDPNSARAFAIRAAISAELKRYDDAIADGNRAVALASTSAFAYRHRAYAWNLKGEPDKAIADCTTAIHLDAKYVKAYQSRAYAYSEKREYDRAIADCTEAIRLDPKYAHAYNSRGHAYNEKREYDRAVADCTEAIRLHPKFAAAFNNRGRAYNEKREYDRGIADCTEAIRLDPMYAHAYNNRGVAYSWKYPNSNQALLDYNRAIELDSRYALAYLNRGKWLRTSSPAQAAADFAKYKELTGKDP